MSEQKYHAPAADGVLEILEFMAENPGPLGPTEIGRATGIGTNLAFRVLNVLSDHFYVSRDVSGKYELGAKLFSIGMKLRNKFELRRIAEPFLRRLSADSGETCQIQIPDGDRMLLLDCVQPDRDYYLSVNPGARLHYHGNAFGKAVLAFLDREEREKILARKLCRMTGATVTDPEKIGRELQDIRKNFVAGEFGEYLEGSYCIGSPVFDASGKVVAGIGITGLTSRPEKIDRAGLEDLVRRCAADITSAAGGTFPAAEREKSERMKERAKK